MHIETVQFDHRAVEDHRSTYDPRHSGRAEDAFDVVIPSMPGYGFSGKPSRLYWKYKGGFFNTKGVSISVAVSVFPGEQYQAPRSWTERAYPELIYYNKLDRGGHFAAWEQPRLFAAELRAAFRSLRQVNETVVNR